MTESNEAERTTIIVVSEQSRAQVETQLQDAVEADIVFCTSVEDVVGAEKALEFLPIQQVLTVGTIRTLALLAFLDFAEHWGVVPLPFAKPLYH